MIGYVRMVQGGHFLSDVLFSFFVTYAAVVGVQSIMVRWGWSVAYRPGANKIRFSNARIGC